MLTEGDGTAVSASLDPGCDVVVDGTLHGGTDENEPDCSVWHLLVYPKLLFTPEGSNGWVWK